MKSNKSLHKIECEKADKCKSNANNINYINNINHKNDKEGYIVKNESIKNLIDIGINDNLKNLTGKFNKETDSSGRERQIIMNSVGANPLQYNYNNKIDCETFSFTIKKHNDDCEKQTKMNSENDLYFSDNNSNKLNNKNYTDNDNLRSNEGSFFINEFKFSSYSFRLDINFFYL
jgi:hypothetical protein